MPRSELAGNQVYDPEIALQPELETVKDNQTGNFIPATMNNYELWLRNQKSGYASLGQLAFGSDLVGYFRNTTSSWRAVRRFFWPGSDDVGVPESWKVIGYMDSGTGDVRIRDLDNNTTICSVTITNTSWQIVTTSSVSNVTTGEAVWEIQAKENTPGNTIYVACAQLVFN